MMLVGTHPNEVGHAYIADQIFKALPERSADEPEPTATVEPTPAATAEPTAEPTASPEPAKEFPFKDVARNSWYYPNVYYVWEKGIMEGVRPDAFAPDATTTRAQFAAVIYRMAGKPDVSNMRSPFTDLTAGWYQDAVTW